MSTAGHAAGHRTPLSRDRVLRTAVARADQDGISALSMRKLGEALGVEAMSLYNHVASKSDLLDGMIDIVFSEIDLPSGDGDWRDAMRRRAISARQVLRRHPWAIGLMESRTSPGPATLRHHDAVLGCLRRAGFSVELTAHAYALLDTEVWLLATPPEAAALGRWVQAIGRRYVSAFNRRHAGSGSLWAGRFRAAVVQAGEALRLFTGKEPDYERMLAQFQSDARDERMAD